MNKYKVGDKLMRTDVGTDHALPLIIFEVIGVTNELYRFRLLRPSDLAHGFTWPKDTAHKKLRLLTPLAEALFL